MKKFKFILASIWFVITYPLCLFIWILTTIGIYLLDLVARERAYNSFEEVIDETTEDMFGWYKKF